MELHQTVFSEYTIWIISCERCSHTRLQSDLHLFSNYIKRYSVNVSFKVYLQTHWWQPGPGSDDDDEVALQTCEVLSGAAIHNCVRTCVSSVSTRDGFSAHLIIISIGSDGEGDVRPTCPSSHTRTHTHTLSAVIAHHPTRSRTVFIAHCHLCSVFVVT